MNAPRQRLADAGAGAFLLAAGSAFVVLFASSCNMSPHFQADAENHAAARPGSPAAREPDPGIDLNCIISHLQNPTESFHYVYRKDASDHLNEEADITPQTIDGSFTDSGFHRAFHGVHSDARNWQSAWSGLIGITGMSSTIAEVSNNSAIVREPGSSGCGRLMPSWFGT